ncbi:hypothetical protein [Legionella tunisiensis]|uniref:hypothetical protein n=1 Tax=Legionella tunisiensis TaxID=1034944 RepID=UPI0002F03211|nr:hypothetical protein [Legionella tunisiensis]
MTNLTDIQYLILNFLGVKSSYSYSILNKQYSNNFKDYILIRYKSINKDLDSYEAFVERLGAIDEADKKYHTNLSELILSRKMSFVDAEHIVDFSNSNNEDKLNLFINLLELKRDEPVDQKERNQWDILLCKTLMRPFKRTALFQSLIENLLPIELYTPERLNTSKALQKL